MLYTDGVLDGASPRLTTEELASVLPTDVGLDDLTAWTMQLGRVDEQATSAPADDAAVLALEIV